MALDPRYEEIILKAAIEHFAAHGFYGARIDGIAEEAGVNKRLVYAYNRTKEGLYLTVLSRVSRDMIAAFEDRLGTIQESDDIPSILNTVFDIFSENKPFARLWVWENMDGTIHGLRLVEAASKIFDRLENFFENTLDKDKCSQIVDLCSTYLISQALPGTHSRIGADLKTTLLNSLYPILGVSSQQTSHTPGN